MKSLASLILGFSQVLLVSAQSNQSDSGTFIIHKFAQAIGKEKYTVTRNGNGILYQVDFKYTDRSSPVRLKDSILFTKEMEPLSFRIMGGTSRFSTVNDSVVYNGGTANMKVNDSSYSEPLKTAYFPIAGYSPATAQMLLIRYWKSHHHPGTIYTPPFGSVGIHDDGTDTFSFQNNRQIFNRYHITGLVWGNELLWTDMNDQLICLITNDAEGDKQEMTSEFYEELLPVFIEKAAVQGMRLFTRDAKPSGSAHKEIAIINTTLIDVVTGDLVPDETILIENGKIRAVGKSSRVKPSQNAYIIDGSGKYVLPGLWDMHAHFEQAEWGPAYLAAGVTTVRDCGNEFDYINAVKNAIDSGYGVGPDILKAGIIDGKGPFALGIIQADNVTEAIAAVSRYKDNGFVQIKIYSSVKPAVVKAICSEAHRLGLTVTGHIPFGMNLEQAIDSGMDMVNHIQYVSTLLKKNTTTGKIDFADSANNAVMKFLKDHHTVIDPTLGVYELAFRPVKDNIMDIEPDFNSLPSPLKPLFINTGSDTEAEIARGKKAMTAFMQVVDALHKNGIPVVVGTDMGFPGYSVFREMELYVASGMTPMDAIRCATIVPATIMKRAAILGSVEAGKNADLILIDRNPMENIRNIRKVSTVIRNGKLYDPAALHKTAGFNN